MKHQAVKAVAEALGTRRELRKDVDKVRRQAKQEAVERKARRVN